MLRDSSFPKATCKFMEEVRFDVGMIMAGRSQPQTVSHPPLIPQSDLSGLELVETIWPQTFCSGVGSVPSPSGKGNPISNMILDTKVPRLGRVSICLSPPIPGDGGASDLLLMEGLSHTGIPTGAAPWLDCSLEYAGRHRNTNPASPSRLHSLGPSPNGIPM